MTTAWTNFKATGNGGIGLRLQIVGVPFEAVTDSSMAGVQADSRERLPHLRISGIVLEEHVDLARATCEPGSFTATIIDGPSVTAGVLNAWTGLFATRPTARCWLAATCTHTDATITVTDTSLFPSAGKLFIDQETIKYTGKTATTFTGCTRGYWDSCATYHYALDTEGARATEITDVPATMEGRRVRLFAYATQDTFSGDGTQVWLGTVSRDARLSADQTAWEITVDPVTRVFASPLGGDLVGDLPMRGAYYAWDCCFRIDCWVSANNTVLGGAVAPPLAWSAQVTGFFETQEAFVEAVNVKILANATTPATGQGLVCVSDGASGFHFELTTGAGANNRFVSIRATSPLDMVHLGGYIGGAPLLSTTGAAVATTITTGLTDSTTYRYPQAACERIPSGTPMSGTAGRFTDAVDAPGSIPRGSWASSPYAVPFRAAGRAGTADLYADFTQAATWPAYRLYPGGTADVSGITSITLDLGGGAPSDATGGTKITAAVTATGATSRYLDCVNGSNPNAQGVCFAGGTAPRITPTRTYLGLPGGTLADMMNPILDATLTGAPLGTAPYLYDIGRLGTTFSDFGSWAAASVAAAGRRIAQRILTTARALTLGDVLTAEAQNIGCFFALDSNGRIAVYQVGASPTGTTRTITTTAELSEEQPSGYERMALGTVARIVVRTGYDPITDQFTCPPVTVVNVTANGRIPAAPPITIAPKSQQVTTIGDASADFYPDYVAVASGTFSLYGYPYDLITIAVPFTLFDALCGDNATITSKNLPKLSAAMRGMVSRSGIIVGRRWDFGAGFGVLTVLATEIDYAGYTPTSRISSQVDNGGNNWTLTIATPASAATAGYSDATAWAVNDLVRVVLYDSTTSTIVTGTVTAVTATTVRVQFTGVWTPAASTWNLEYGLASAPWQTSQQAYCAVADSSDLITYSTTTSARQFAP